MNNLKKLDPEIYNLIEEEKNRQHKEINLIASENYPNQEILEITGSVLANKYAEGYPGKRYYAGCKYVDQAETLAINRAKILFDAEHANVQPHSGSQANMAVYNAILKPGDTIMGMSLSSGGHLTHGHNANFSGSIYKTVQYGVNQETELLDYDQLSKLAYEHKPKLIIAGASAYSQIMDFEKFSQIAKSVNAYFMADIAHIAGIVAVGLHPSPIPYADFTTSTTHKTLRGPRGGFILSKSNFQESIDKSIIPGIQGGPFMNAIAAKATTFKLAAQEDFKAYIAQVLANAKVMSDTFKELGYRIVSGDTQNHLFIVDLTSKNITGRDAELVLEKAGINLSRSTIPFDTQKPWVTSGIRIGTPFMTSLGLKEDHAKNIVYLIDDILRKFKKTK